MSVRGPNERTSKWWKPICDLVGLQETQSRRSYRDLIEFVPDRPGHDRRYAIDPSKIERELGWRPTRELRERDRENGGLVPCQRTLVATDPPQDYRGERLGRAREGPGDRKERAARPRPRKRDACAQRGGISWAGVRST